MEWNGFSSVITDVCYKKYGSLPKSGKPHTDGSQWTSCAAIVKRNSDGTLKVVSLATGSRCIGKSRLNATGTLVHDSHAEVLARRGFLRYLYEQIEMFQRRGTSDVIEESNFTIEKFKLKDSVEFHFFSSHIPCGDASIIPKCDGDEGLFNGNNRREECKCFDSKRKLSDSETEDRCKKSKMDCFLMSTCPLNRAQKNQQENSVYDVFRTGAKCVPSDSRQDALLPGVKYHSLGAVRTKPGRGDPTMSVSCSDKIARWNAVGIQGALLSHLLEHPIFLKTIVIGGGGPFCEESILRALVKRFNAADIHIPLIMRSSIVFTHARYGKPTSQPAPASIIWCDVSQKPLEIGVDGKKQGATKGAKNDYLLVCRKSLFQKFISLTGEKFKSQTYFDCKQAAEAYQCAWKLRKSQLGAWTEKPPELQHFKIDNPT
ncbi:unnamed protein product [Bemisia tabaci]|uniref:tRNA-specific adenosine deaminase 1 n=2 Tax=Bemisia tabaci TaxID=7038 RepID=A0A9P0A585_BEMTA|nr:PREDICTED: tRNA-specific adenosine deaminase 1 isoform X2 [Bemisia tabaci]XP_018908673.1 PREDICTED: tRNA-specific adenosine deaminase 1 isoform X2 [Bemisia tabaci]CAH0385929.1 unnamed protein product [Bemisia tabaci]